MLVLMICTTFFQLYYNLNEKNTTDSKIALNRKLSISSQWTPTEFNNVDWSQWNLKQEKCIVKNSQCFTEQKKLPKANHLIGSMTFDNWIYLCKIELKTHQSKIFGDWKKVIFDFVNYKLNWAHFIFSNCTRCNFASNQRYLNVTLVKNFKFFVLFMVWMKSKRKKSKNDKQNK